LRPFDLLVVSEDKYQYWRDTLGNVTTRLQGTA